MAELLLSCIQEDRRRAGERRTGMSPTEGAGLKAELGNKKKRSPFLIKAVQTKWDTRYLIWLAPIT